MQFWNSWESVECFSDTQRCFCEGIHEGGIVEPANTWSNLPLIFVGLIILWDAYKHRSEREGIIKTFTFSLGLSMIMVGVGYFLLHASMTRVGGFLDWFGMCLVLLSLVLYAIGSVYGLSSKRYGVIVFALSLVGAFFSVIDPFWSKWTKNPSVPLQVASYPLGVMGKSVDPESPVTNVFPVESTIMLEP